MGEARPELELNIVDPESNEAKLEDQSVPVTQPPEAAVAQSSRDLNSWIRVIISCVLVVFGQSAAVILGRLYFEKGPSNGIWLETLVQVVGFPALIPLYFIVSATAKKSIAGGDEPKEEDANNIHPDRPSILKLASIYIFMGLLYAANAILLSLGILYLPVTTYSLISASQLAFNAVFSFFLNKQKLTPYIINSVFVLTISSVILVTNSNDSQVVHVSKAKYAIGFICTLVASAGAGLSFALNQLVFQKVLLRGGGRHNNMILMLFEYMIFISLVASAAVTVGLFVSGEWRRVNMEMHGYESGPVSYVMNLVGSALLWESFAVSCIGLTVEVGALFANVMSTLALPITPVLAVIFIHDKMNGLKVVSLLLAIWGFVSYAYQQYLDEFKTKGQDLQITPMASSSSQNHTS